MYKCKYAMLGIGFWLICNFVGGAPTSVCKEEMGQSESNSLFE